MSESELLGRYRRPRYVRIAPITASTTSHSRSSMLRTPTRARRRPVQPPVARMAAARRRSVGTAATARASAAIPQREATTPRVRWWPALATSVTARVRTSKATKARTRAPRLDSAAKPIAPRRAATCSQSSPNVPTSRTSIRGWHRSLCPQNHRRTVHPATRVGNGAATLRGDRPPPSASARVQPVVWSADGTSGRSVHSSRPRSSKRSWLCGRKWSRSRPSSSGLVVSRRRAAFEAG